MRFRLIQPKQHEENRDLLDDVFRLRHRIFNQWLKWGLSHNDGKETDEYDQNAYIFVCIDDDNNTIGTWRAMPTTQPFFSKGAFPSLFKNIAHWQPDSMTWDLSRMAVDRARFVDDRVALGQIICGMACSIFELSIVHGITQLISTQDYRMTRAANYWLGKPEFGTEHIKTGDGNVGLYCYTPNLERLYSMRTMLALSTPALEDLALFDPKHPKTEPTGEFKRGIYA